MTDNRNVKTAKHAVDMETLKVVVGKMFDTDIDSATVDMKELQGGTVGDVHLVSGVAETNDGRTFAYEVVLKIQKKWNRPSDSESWRREYDLYTAGIDDVFCNRFSWPTCYHSEIHETETRLWMEYIQGVSGMDMTVDMYEKAAYEIGCFQGRIHATEQPVLQNVRNLSSVDFAKNSYYTYRSWTDTYEYIRSETCTLPEHIRKMIIDIDNRADALWQEIEKLPTVFCHRDYWNTNIFCHDHKVNLIDWDTSGWGHIGEDIASLIADESDVEQMLEYYKRCVPAYFKGLSEFMDVSDMCITYIHDLILLMFGYRLVRGYQFAAPEAEREMCLRTLSKIYEMSLCKI